MNNFVDEYKKVKIGSKIKIKIFFLMHGRRRVPYVFLEWISRYKNQFTVESIQEVNDSAMISVEEVNGSVEYDQIEVLGRSKRILNWHRKY